MSSVEPNKEGSPYNSVWSTYNKYCVKPFSAGLGIIPVFYLFQAKSALQRKDKVPAYNFVKSLKDGYKVAPTIGAVVGTQLVGKVLVKEYLQKATWSKNFNEYTKEAMSAVAVGAVSSPLLAMFNGMSNGLSAKESWKKFSKLQFGAILARETTFLASDSLIPVVNEGLKEVCGDNKFTKYFSAFTSGAIGSVVGHPCDTALTLWQNGMKVEKISDLFKRGVKTKATAVGAFYILYTLFVETLTKNPKR